MTKSQTYFQNSYWTQKNHNEYA